MKIKSLVILVLFVCLTVTASFGQSWSKEQQEVWKAVDGLWAAWTGGDLDLYRSLMDDNYRWWNIKRAAPTTKQEGRPWGEYNIKNYPMKIYKINPMAIDIYDDIAIVFYYSQSLIVKADGTEISRAGKNLDIYRKNGGKWLIIADFSGAM